MDREQVYQELKADHWDKVYNWNAIELKIDTAARRAGCTVDELRVMMREIESKYPKLKRKTWRNIEFKKPCRTCGTVIGFARTDER